LINYSSPLRSITLLVGALLLSACQESAPEAMLKDYAARMGNVLETEIELELDQAVLAILVFPVKRERLVATTELREGLWDVLDFRQCDMLHLISERNSSLGKVMAPSQKMRYELRFVSALQNCYQTLEAIEEPDETQQAFQERLESIYQTKLANLPIEVWNGIYGSDEISHHFKLGKPPLPIESISYGSPQNALEKLSELAALSDSESITLPDWLNEIETHYEALHRSELGAGLLVSLSMMTHTLDRTAKAIETRLARKPFCFEGHQPPRATILSNVFQKYYAGEVQPYMAIIQREGNRWFGLHDAMIKRLPAPSAMQDYRLQVLALESESSMWGKWVRARERHTKAWQKILGQCNMMPGSNSTPE